MFRFHYVARFLSLSIGLLLLVSPLYGAVRFSTLFTDHAVLQRDRELPLRGEGSPGEEVTVSLIPKWDGADEGAVAQASATADRSGVWSLVLPPREAGGPYELLLQGKKTQKHLTDLWFGDVWIFAGGDRIGETVDRKEILSISQVEKDSLPTISVLSLSPTFSEKPKSSIRGTWKPWRQADTGSLCALASVFGIRVGNALNVPIGLITISIPSSSTEAWIDPVFFDRVPLLESLTRSEIQSGRPEAERPGGIWNGTLAPLTRMAICGIVFEPSELNIPRAYQYRVLFSRLIDSWRYAWREGDFPIFYLELGAYQGNKPMDHASAAAEFREAQRFAALPQKVQGVVTLDLGTPPSAVKIGTRLATLALAQREETGLYTIGPELLHYDFHADQVILQFRATGGLTVHSLGESSEEEPIEVLGFSLAGEDGRFFAADAVIEGDRVILSSPLVPVPRGVRYNWGDAPEGNLYDSLGIPLPAFRTDSFPGVTEENY